MQPLPHGATAGPSEIPLDLRYYLDVVWRGRALIAAAALAGLSLGLLVGFLHRGLSLGFTLARRPLATLGREERLDQLLPPEAAKPLDPELRRDRVEIGERALL